MVLPSTNNGDSRTNEPNLLHFCINADDVGPPETHRLSEEIDSTCSTPYVSAPSSPGRSPSGPSGYYFSAPASPMHFVLSRASSSSHGSLLLPTETLNSSGSFEFEFSSRFSLNVSSGSGSMSSADELFLNGQIRPMKLSTHLQRPQVLSPLLDLDGEEEELRQRESEFERSEETVRRGRELRQRNGSLDRKARSLSPLRNAEFERHEENVARKEEAARQLKDSEFCKQNDTLSNETTPSCSASSSRSSSSGRNSKKWIFLKDLLHRSKSEGSGNNKEKFWSSILFSPSKEKKISSPTLAPSSTRDGREKTNTEPSQKHKQSKKATSKKPAARKPANGVSKRRVPTSAHELHYTASRAQAEEMRKKTFLPYRQGLLGCLGFSSKGYGALNGLARTLNPVSSR